MLSPKQDIYITCSPLVIQETLQKTEQRDCQRHSRELQGNVCWTQQGSYTYEFTDMKTVHTRALQVQARPNPSMEGGGGHTVLPLAEELLIIDNCQARRSPFFSRV